MNRYAWLIAAALAGAAVCSPGLAQAPASYDVAILQPADEETVLDNEGNVVVEVAVWPDLARGNRVVVALDGRPVAQVVDATFALSGVERGAHTLQALVVDANGRTLAASQPVIFYMWQASRLFPSRKGK